MLISNSWTNCSHQSFEKEVRQNEKNIQSIAKKILYAPILPPLLANNEAWEKKIDQIKNDMESMVGRNNIKYIIERMLQALVSLSTILRSSTI